jgi:hypothetical protein
MKSMLPANRPAVPDQTQSLHEVQKLILERVTRR